MTVCIQNVRPDRVTLSMEIDGKAILLEFDPATGIELTIDFKANETLVPLTLRGKLGIDRETLFSLLEGIRA